MIIKIFDFNVISQIDKSAMLFLEAFKTVDCPDSVYRIVDPRFPQAEIGTWSERV
ncbi:MAG: hypothetical protein G01um101444_161 [Parcubacteria group bacterium Gr01-1014_44]|nr:MAG: hypothetical protein G01um101444_161 [Parcubacteria group bacterium Gr01-1014_44]